MDHADLVALHFPFARRAITSAELAATKPFEMRNNSREKPAILLLHGFTGTPAVWRPLAEKLQALDFTVSSPLLAGHGTKAEDLLAIRWEDWYQSGELALKALMAESRDVIVIGLSLGGTLALQLAAHHPSIKRILLVAPAVYPTRLFNLFIQSRLGVGLNKLGISYMPPIGGNIKKKSAWEICYPRTPIHAMQELYQCLEATQAMLPNIRTPVTLFQSRRDLLVPPSRVSDIIAQLGSPEKEVIWFDQSYHVIPLDNDADHLAEEIINRL